MSRKKEYSSGKQFYESPDVDQKYKDIMKVIDPIFDDMYDGNEWDYLNENEMKKSYMDQVKRREINWRKSKKCIYPNCNEPSITRSHTIQKSASIESIAEEGHVYTPYLSEKPSELEYFMKSVGVNEASTFPGFCVKHEKLFQRFEQHGELNDPEDYKLQVYRTICRELVFNEHELQAYQEFYEAYKKKIENIFISELESVFGKNIKEIGLKSVKIENNDNSKKLHDKATKEFTLRLRELMNLHEACLKNDLYYVTIKVPFQIPIAIAGISNTYLINKETNKEEDTIIIVNCLPYQKRTELIISTFFKYKDSLLEIVKYISQTQLSLLNFIESFLVNGSEHFFIKKSTWNLLSSMKQKQILNDIFYSNWNIRKEYEFSIFDEIREYLINQGEIAIKKSGGADASLIKHINMEKEKLQREPIENSDSIVDLVYKAAKKELQKGSEIK